MEIRFQEVSNLSKREIWSNKSIFVHRLPTENQELYRSLQEFGYVLIFKPVMKNKDNEPKGNIDAELVLQVMIDWDKYDKAVITSSDGDFYCLVNYLYEKKKLKRVISPNYKKCSALLKKAAREKIDFLDYQRDKLTRK
jgi:uncharacterized LabA/DUF88 family protein